MALTHTASMAAALCEGSTEVKKVEDDVVAIVTPPGFSSGDIASTIESDLPLMAVTTFCKSSSGGGACRGGAPFLNIILTDISFLSLSHTSFLSLPVLSQ